MAREHTPERTSTIPPPSSEGVGLPAVIPQQPPPRSSRWHHALLVVVVIAAGTRRATYWVAHREPPLPPGIVWSNGRLEADEIDIDAKFAGRIATVLFDEGDIVHGGQVVARMDTRDLDASLKQAECTDRAGRAQHRCGAGRARAGGKPGDAHSSGIAAGSCLAGEGLRDARGGGPAPVAIQCGPRGLHRRTGEDR